ncbi:Dynein assembly factor 1, axonemal [Cocos nucifera]|nr:Dynein assembly factor 1, axonemal [Cocos nucifera]
MARFNCFSTLLVGKKKKEKSRESPNDMDLKKVNTNVDLRVKPEEFVNPLIGKGTKEASFEVLVPSGTTLKSSICNVKMVEEDRGENLVGAEAAYEGGDEHEEIVSMKRDYSDVDLQAQAADKGESNLYGLIGSNMELNNYGLESKYEREEGITPEMMIQSGHVSDPGMGRTTAFWGSPKLKRSCSNIETKRSGQFLESPTKSHSYSDLQNLSGNVGGDAFNVLHGSPLSMKSNCSADRVMLKKRSSSQVLPSRSRKLWWRLFLWSHRNLHKPWTSKVQRRISVSDASNQKGGYTSDTLEPSGDMRKKKPMKEPTSSTRTDLWPQNQWVAFSAESSSIDRVNAWVNSLEDNLFCPLNDDDNNQNSFDIGESSTKNHSHSTWRLEEVVQANNVIQSLNSLSSVAHISGMGLRVIPAISAFTSLRSINLSSNFIVHISPGSLPKSLHTLDLSRNKIATIEGLRELTRLRVLNLSYNRISRIGHGLSNCTLIKELYLAGNKISDVEGLHRLLKLTVLDLSFNKITTAKALGQLVANYNSLLALNLLGNPIQRNIGDDQLRKAVSGLLPQLAYLNKQPIKPQRAREVATDSVAKAALGNGGWSSRRRATRRVSQGSNSSIRGRNGEGNGLRGLGSSGGQKDSRHGSKSRHQHSISLRK